MKITRPFIATSLLIAASSSLVGCAEDVATCDVRTTGFWVDMQAVASGEGDTQVRAELRVGGDNGTYGQLCDNDSLVAFGDDDGDGELESVEMGENNNGDVWWYLSRFGTDDDNGEFRIEFLREDEDFQNAVNNTVNLPAPFSMSIEGLDSQDEEIQRGNDVTVTWDDNEEGTINWEIDGDCIGRETGNTDDDGEFTISADLIEVDLLDEGESCTVKVELERIRDGVTDELFHEDSRFKGIQRRGFEFTSTPAPGEGEDNSAGGAGGSN